MNAWNPGRLLQLSGGYWSTCALHAGVKLGVFTALAGRRLSADRLCRALKTDRRGLTMLLDALTAMELLGKKGGGYRNMPAAEKFLSRKSPAYIGYMILHHHYLVESWANLDRAVKTGKPVRKRSARMDPARREAFLMGMFNNARSFAPLIVPHIDLSGRRRLLDLGGGPGTYAIEFCRRNPRLNAEVFDLPTTRPFAVKTIKRFSMGGRIRFQPGDYLRDKVRGTFDAAWLSHILHAEGPAGCRRILRRAVEALAPGGLILVHDFYLRAAMDGPRFPALFTLNMLLGTRAGQSYSEAQVRAMLEEAGIRKIRRIPLSVPNDSGVLAGVK
ncbi:MAG: methyltransferase [Elusimicrobiota bacterium]